MGAGMHGNSLKGFYSINKNGKIQTKTKINDEIVVQEFDYYEGPLIGIKIVEENYEGNPVFKLKLTFQENGGLVQLSCGAFTLAGKDIINRLCNCPDFSYIRVTPYTSVDENTKKEFTRASIKHHSEKIHPKFQKEEIPPIKEIIVGKRKVIDDSEQNEFYSNLVLKLSQKIEADLNGTPVEALEVHEEA